MLRPTVLLSAFAVAAALQAQTHDHATHDCAAQTLTQRYLASQGLPTDLRATRPQVTTGMRGGNYTVPVVVHVVWNTAAENVPDAAIQALITEMNEDYSQSNPDVGQVRPAFNGVVGNVGFNFCLAQVDPQGNATTGITRTQTSDTWFDPDNETDDMKFAPTGRAAWDPERYLNIWICDITSGASGSTVTVGYAYLPQGGIVGSGIDGLVIDYDYGTQLGARTATHEIGHYFGLYHTFDDGGSCVDGDGFTDTPTTNSPTFSCSNTNLMKCGVLTQYENFMDYSNCTVMFTDQQASYMAGVLTSVRDGLLANAACQGPVTGYCVPTAVQGTGDGDFINSVQLGQINNANTGGVSGPSYTNYSATIGAGLTQGVEYTISIQGGSYQPDHYAAWIDYDQDEVFETAEKLGEFVTNAVNQTQTITFTVPLGATAGNTRMRVRGVYHNTGEPTPNTDPCFNYAYGETEDYGITIWPPVTGPCIPTSVNGPIDGDFINRVALGTFNNANSGGTSGPAYTNYSTVFSTQLTRATQYTLTVQGGTYQPDHYAAWIDYDQDDTFEAAEKLGEFVTNAANQTQTITFTVPAGAALGGTVMRVRGVFHNTGEPTPDTDPCYAYGYGETEDYGITIITQGGGLCIPTSVNGTADGDYINRVAVGTLNNANSGGVTGPSYTDYGTSYTTSLARGLDYVLSVQGGTYQPDHYAAWIDYDQDNTFEANEKLGEFTSSAANQTQTLGFEVPLGATLGATKLRVRGVYHGEGEPTPATDPCFAYAYGETEDYTVTIGVTTGITEQQADDILLFPNPASGSVRLSLPDAASSEITLVDAVGRSVATHRTTGASVELPLEGIATGTYLVRVLQGGSTRVLRLEVANGH